MPQNARNPARPPASPRRWALAVWLLGLLLTLGLTVQQQQLNQEATQAHFTRLTDELARGVQQRFGLYEYGLRGARMAVISAGGERIAGSVFTRAIASRDLAREFPGARGFGFIRRVPREAEADFLARARAEGPADFAIRTIEPHAQDRYVIQYIYPLEQNRQAVGLDIGSERNRREAARQAALSGEPRLTAPITLMQAAESQRRGFLILFPVYREGEPLQTASAREDATLGWVYAPLVVDTVLRGMDAQLQQVRLRLTDRSEREPFYRSDANDRPTGTGLSSTRELRIMGREWRMEAEAQPALLAAARLRNPAAVLALGAVLSSLAALVLLLALSQRQERLTALGLPQLAAGRALRTFLGSRLTLLASLAWLLGMLVYLMLAQAQIRARMAAELASDLGIQAQQLVQQRVLSLEARRKVMAFLVDTPPVLGLWRSLPSGRDPLDGSSREHWERRMQQIFAAHLRAAPEVLSLRLILTTGKPQELMHVERSGTAVLGRPNGPPDAALLELIDLALRRPAGQMLVAPPQPGAADAEGRAHWHNEVLMPVHLPDGQPMAVMVARVDLSERLASGRALLAPDQHLFVMDDEQRLLLTPDALLVPRAPGRAARWTQAYQAAPSPWLDEQPALKAWAGPGGPLLTLEAVFQPNSNGAVGAQRYVLAQPLATLDARLRAELLERMQLPLFLGLLGLTLLYLFWAGNQRQLHLRAERMRQARLLDQSRDAFIGLDAEQRITSWNEGAQHLFGRTAAEVTGKALVDLLRADAPWPRLGEEPRRYETRVAGRAAEPLEVAVDWTPLQGLGSELGDTTVGSLTLRDVGQERSAQRRVQQLNAELEQQVQARTADLAQERQRLANIIEGTDVGTWEWNVQTGEVRLNARWAEIVGRRLEDLAPVSIQTWADLGHPEDLERSKLLLARHFRGELASYECEARMRHRDGHWVWVLDRGRVFSWTADGQPEWMFGTHQDISALKETSLKLQHTAGLLQGVLRSATEVSVIATDTEGLITVFNAGAERLLGYRADEMVGKQSPAILHLPEEVAARSHVLSLAWGERIEGFRVFVHVPEREGSELREWTYVHKDGHQVPVALVVTAMREDDGRLIGYLGMAQDVSERRRAEHALRAAKRTAEAANAAKSMFLANMSHEIRTPMNAVLGVAHLLQDTPLDPDQRQLLGKLQLAGRSLLAIINDVLDLAKIEAGELRLESVATRPRELLDEVRALVEPQAQAKQLALHVTVDPAVPEGIRTDPQRLRQVLLNLASNAVKFTATGAVTLEVAPETGADGREWLHWAVRDTGIGIPADAQAQLFKPFIQADASTTRHFGGTGLGLAIVRELSERMGGGVQLQSEPGQGSCFTVRLPLERAEAQASDETRQGLRALIVEDDDAQREALATHCRALGWQVEALGSGAEMLARLGPAAALSDPDVLLLDWQLGTPPDGLAALDQLAHQRGAAPLPAALVVTAHDAAAVRAAPGAQWVDEVLAKPVQASALFNTVNRAVVKRTGMLERVFQATRIDAMDAEWLHGVKVLVVDDNELNRDVAQRLLSREGAQVVTAESGALALALLDSTDSPFDAVLMDVQMPGMDGLETTRRLRQLPAGAQLPVLALTAGALEEERQRALAAGMEGFLSKPLEPALLVRRLRQSVEAKRRQPLAAVSVARTAAASDWPRIAGIESLTAELHMGGDRDFFLRSLRRMLDEHGPALARAAVDAEPQRDPADLLARLHKLRGSAGQLGALGLHAVAGEAEQALRDGQPAVELLAHLAAQFEALAAAAAPALLAPTAPPVSTGPAPEGPDWEQLVAQLRGNDLEALGGFHTFLAGLGQRLGASQAEALEQCVLNLDFSAALQMLDAAGLGGTGQGPDR